RLCDDRRRAGTGFGDDQSVQLPGRALLRQGRLWRRGGDRAVRDRPCVHARPRASAAAHMVGRVMGRTGAVALASWIVVGAFMLPFLWMVLGSFKTTGDFLSYPPVWLVQPTLANYRHV